MFVAVAELVEAKTGSGYSYSEYKAKLCGFKLQSFALYSNRVCTSHELSTEA